MGSLNNESPLFFCRDDPKEYALKQIEGTGISMSACREIAVSVVGRFFFERFNLIQNLFSNTSFIIVNLALEWV